MRHALAGATLVVAGIAAFIEIAAHKPTYGCRGSARICGLEEGGYLQAGHLSQTAYDLIRIGGWALMIFGTLLIITGLIRYWATQRSRPEAPQLRRDAG